jgi:hypothetical protein
MTLAYKRTERDLGESMTSAAVPASACRVSSRRWFVLASRLGAVAGVTAGKSNAVAQSQQDLAKKLANPVAALISVPFQFNWDQKVGPADDGTRYRLNVQPVVPVTLNDDWNLISRTIVPVVSQRHISFPARAASPASATRCRVCSSHPRNRSTA